jgi:hypothetical protein
MLMAAEMCTEAFSSKTCTTPRNYIVSQPTRPQMKMTRGPGRLLPSNSAMVMQHGSAPSSYFLSITLGVSTSPFLHNTQFYFSLSPLFCCKSHKRNHLHGLCASSVGSTYNCGVSNLGSIPNKPFFK